MKIKMCFGGSQKMRLYNIYYLCKQYIEEMGELKVTEKGTISTRYYVLDNWAEYKKSTICHWAN